MLVESNSVVPNEVFRAHFVDALLLDYICQAQKVAGLVEIRSGSLQKYQKIKGTGRFFLPQSLELKGIEVCISLKEI